MAKAKKKKPVAKNIKIPMPVANEKFSVWVNQLPYKEFKMVTDFVGAHIEHEVNRSCKYEREKLTDVLDRCVTAALITGTNFSMDEINDILLTSSEMMPEDILKLKKLENKGDGDWMKAAEKHAENVTNRAMELITEGKKQKESIEILLYEFPMFSKAMLTNSYKRCKEEMKRQVEEAEKETVVTDDLEVEKALEYIFEDDKTIKETLLIKEKEAAIEVKENIKELKENVQEFKAIANDPAETGLIILSKKLIMDVAGEFGTYHIEDKKVKIDDVVFTNMDEAMDYYDSIIKDLMKRQNEVMKIYEMVGR